MHSVLFWAAVPPALHQIRHARHQQLLGLASVGESTECRHDVLAWAGGSWLDAGVRRVVQVSRRTSRTAAIASVNAQ